MTEKTLEWYADVFADIVNARCFGGRQVVRPEELSDAQPGSLYKMAGASYAQERDVLKLWSHGLVRLCLIGLENQSAPDADMALRSMSYDAAAYRRQVDANPGGERFPVVTIVLYFGTERRWTAPRTLRERLRLGERQGFPRELEPFVNDYRLNLMELAWLDEEEAGRFQSDFREVVEFLRAERLHTRYEGSLRRLDHAMEMLDLLKALSGDGVFDVIRPTIARMMNGSEGGVKMYDLVQTIKREGFSMDQQSVFSLGKSEGFSLGKREATDRLVSLFSMLYSAGRGADVQRATQDRAYLQQLMDEYQQ